MTPSLQLAGQLEADHLRQQHGERLAEHAGFRLDAADAPAEHGEAVDHGRVRIGADQRIGIGDLERAGLLAARHLLLAGPDRLREIFEIDLVADAGAGRHDAEIRERLLAPFQELVALAVAAHIRDRRSCLNALLLPKKFDDHRMIDDEIDRHQRIDLLRHRRRASVMASRIAARSTTAGTPVKSCISTRAGRNAISCSVLPLLSAMRRPLRCLPS